MTYFLFLLTFSSFFFFILTTHCIDYVWCVIPVTVWSPSTEWKLVCLLLRMFI